MDIGKKLKSLRKKAGFKQVQIASYLNIDQTYLSKIEAGERKVPIEILENLAILYRITLEDFEKDDININPISLSMRSDDINDEDLHTIAIINKVAHNSQLMAKLIESRIDNEK